MSNILGDNIKVSIFGQSHSDAIGVTVDGLPAGFAPDFDELNAFLKRRAPGGALATSRKEADAPEFICGIVDGKTCGAPVTAIIRNTNTRSADYAELKDKPRPAHSDFAAYKKFGGYNDIAGGGQFSGRLTAPLCVAGGLILQLLKKQGVNIYAHISQIGGISDKPFDMCGPFEDVSQKELAVIDDEALENMKAEILSAKEAGDSVGGVIECAIEGLPAGIGEPMFGGMENVIARAVFGVPAVKGIEFGSGFAGASKRGSENNDGFIIKDGEILTQTNNHGGILGGITSGMPIIFRAAMKPTPSILIRQKSVSLCENKEAELQIKGRHDPCVVTRAVPVIEAVAAIAVYDAMMTSKKFV